MSRISYAASGHTVRVHEAALNWAPDVDALAELAGLNLDLEYDPDAPMPFAVWSEDETGEQDIIGAGASPSEAIEDARNTVRGWEASRG